VLTPDFVAAVVVENERGTLAGRGLALKLEAHALIIAIQGLLRLCRADRNHNGDQKRPDQQSRTLSSESHFAFHHGLDALRRQPMKWKANSLPIRSSSKIL
jgi:hypothetical protein